MDLIIYIIVLVLIGISSLNRTKAVSESVGIIDSGATVTVDCDLPISENLALKKEFGAYTLILEQFGLK